ncbi:MAG TPA: inositol monophosphatase [Actinobacteria bacterium]|nr:inositol-1-monophosphatase [bacterium BMS3Bbin01]HDH27036.1 inositol monophosphatase [Actinomycetota bacterium]HDL49774.1 inositol monophosphatase [Actinomycetota bacterium]
MVADSIERRVFAEELAVEAGQLALSYRGRDDLQVRSKGVLDWVTEADLATERLIRRRIAESFPHDRVLGEEGGDVTPPTGVGHAMWVVDPIDGTTCFVSGLPSWCVSIACVDESGHPFLGVVRDPGAAETFSALEGHGLTINGHGISVPDKGITGGLVGVGHPRNAPDGPTLTFLQRLFAAGGLFYNCGSAALALAYVAAGRLVGFFESDLRAWDALAGEVLVRESGGWSTSFVYDGSPATGKPVLAANRGSADALRDLAADLLGGCSRPPPVLA